MADGRICIEKDVTADLIESKILAEYVNVHQKCRKDLCELTFLRDYPRDNTRRIIKYMLDKYTQITSIINKYPSFLIEFVFKYRCMKDGCHDHTVKFSTHMPFHDDILMICYISYGSKTPEDFNRSTVLRLMIHLMRHKYDIGLGTPLSQSFLGLNSITFISVSYSYLSITYEILYNMLSDALSRMFPYFNLPLGIYIPWIIFILPMLNDYPIAILIVIFSVCLPILRGQNDLNMPLIRLYKYILHVSNNSKIPEKMKLYLCMRYNIVVLEDNIYKFTPCFATYRQKAKDIISEKWSNDPHLENILSKI